MKTDKQLVERIAKLARLEFNDQEMEQMIADFDKIVTFMDKLKEVDTSNVESVRKVLPLATSRKDSLGSGFSQNEVLKNAPSTDGKFFMVPKVLDK